MYVPCLFKSFFMGGFECSTHRRDDGRRLDLLQSTGHDRWAAEDYATLRRLGLQTVRDGVRWHLIEQQAGRYDWSSFLPMLRAAQQQDVQVIWDLGHYGCPDDIDIWQPAFVERFARFAAAVAQQVRDESDQVPFYVPINEISFWSWAGGEVGYFNPCALDRSLELKHQLVRASIAAIEAIRAIDARARFVLVDPLIHVVPRDKRAASQADAEAYRLSQFQAWDMLAGRQWPGLGGKPEYLDIIGVNFYSNNQWYMGGGTLWRGEPGYRPLVGMLSEIYQRYQRPLCIAETGDEIGRRAAWFRYVCEQVELALQRTIPIEGICYYPILDYPGWVDDRHCSAGLLGFADAQGQRPLYAPLGEELKAQQAYFAEHLLASRQALTS